MNTYADFKADMRVRESGDRYSIKNKYGFLGAYQFGLPRLVDLGLCSVDPYTRRITWIRSYSETMFLLSKTLQDACFDIHVGLHKKSITTRLAGQIDGVNSDLSGCIAVAHLLGLGGLHKFLVGGHDGADALGTKASDYMKLFRGYDIPDGLENRNLPTVFELQKDKGSNV